MAEPEWVRRHGLVVGACYITDDSDLTLEFLGVAQVRDRDGYRFVMVFRDLNGRGPLLTLGEHDAERSAGFTPLGDHLLGRIDDEGAG